MDASFESLCSPPAFAIHQAEQSDSRPNFLSAIKNLHQSIRKPLRLKQRANYGSSQSSQSSVDLSKDHSRSFSESVIPIDYYEAPRRQGIAPDMDDYLSLDQLEGLWQYQDSYVGPVATPLTSSTFNYQEAVEAPTFVQHKLPNEVLPVPQTNSVTNLGTTGSDEALVIDGHLHPAIRSTPNLSRSAPPTPHLGHTVAVEQVRPVSAEPGRPITSEFERPISFMLENPVIAKPERPISPEPERQLPPTPPSNVADEPLPAPSPINRARVDSFPRLSAIGKPLVSKDGKPVMSKMAKPVPIPAEKLAPSWTQRRQFLREVPGVI